MHTLIFAPTQKYSLWSSISLWIFCGIGIFFTLTLLSQAVTNWPSDSSYKNVILGLPLLLFFVWFRIQFFGQSTITINSEIISQRQPVVSPRVAWNNIASVQFKESTRMVNGAGAMVRVHRRLAEIKTKNNKRVNFVLSTLGQSDREQVERWLEQAVSTGDVPGELLVILKNK
ncbi:MAG: hypothetical protein KAZ30_01375 [Candidatus Magasanikbacteria bacterium]|nr:hypothetical protein [Candidatus Magasanikbacteria bacterium]